MICNAVQKLIDYKSDFSEMVVICLHVNIIITAPLGYSQSAFSATSYFLCLFCINNLVFLYCYFVHLSLGLF